MVVTDKYFSAPIADYDWNGTTASDIMPILQVELEAWIASCNSNGGNINKQLTLLKGYADNTGNTRGWVIQCGYGDGTNNFVFAFLQNTAATNSTSAGSYRILDDANYTNDSGNNGYGTFGSTLFTTSSVGWYTSGTASDFIVAYSSDANQEFFSMGWNHQNGGASYQDGFIIFKDQNDRWGVITCDSSSVKGVYQQNTSYNLIEVDRITDSFDSGYLMRGRFLPFSSAMTGLGFSPGNKVDVASYFAHPQLYVCDGVDFRLGGHLTDGTNNFFGLMQYYFVLEQD